ncbi:MAG TPA: alpha-L-arabinofuranosidase [Verrucomicrobiae bacterium]|nr:alpha-L-arabinofuranosidase [Verrucomicrobiae bacterium]
MQQLRRLFWLAPWLALEAASVPFARAQAPLPIYSDHLLNGFQDWGWASVISYTNTAPVHSGSSSIGVSASYWQALQIGGRPFSTTLYSNLVFWINGGAGGGQSLQAQAVLASGSAATYVLPGTLPANTWKQYSIPLSAIGAANVTDFEGFFIQLRSSGTTNTFYVDDVQLTSKPGPALVHLNLNASQAVRGVDVRWFGLNTAVWDGNFKTATSISLLKEAGARILRFPGGSLSDQYHWASNTTESNKWTCATSFSDFASVATNIGAQAIITVNYGSGTAAEAAAWVRDSNITNHYGFKYWEIGNEEYGAWETDTNIPPNDGYTYANRAALYIEQMKAADPTIKVGIVVTPGQDSSVNGNTTHPATNSITGQVHYGWTPVVLATLKALGVTPDFAVHHRYPEYTDPKVLPACPDSDSLLLQGANGWTGDVADLRQQITGYFGAGGTNIELVCTENNSDAGAPGRQSTSLVNGLYYAATLGELMKTELNGFVWWDLRNGTDTTGSFDPSLYGWRTNGDLGMIGNLSTRYPPFYAAKLMHYFAQPGDTILNAASDYPLLSAYAARRASGAVSLLVLNKDSASNFNAQVTLTGFVPNLSVPLLSFGIPQDEAARTNGPVSAQDIATNNFPSAGAVFNKSFPPLSLNLLELIPAPPRLSVLAISQPGALGLALEGQSGVRYVLESSTNLTVWNSVLTNTLTGPTLNFTSALPAGPAQMFWRALWQP